MAPRTPKPSNFLKKCSITVVGSLGKDAKTSDVEKWTVNNGGIFNPKVNDRTTHVICTWDTFRHDNFALAKKYSDMKKLQMVEWAWLNDTLQSKRTKPVKKYLHSGKWSTNSKKKVVRRQALLTGKSEKDIEREQDEKEFGLGVPCDIDDNEDDNEDDNHDHSVAADVELKPGMKQCDTTEEEENSVIKYSLYEDDRGFVYDVYLLGSELLDAEGGDYHLSIVASKEEPKQYKACWKYYECGEDAFGGDIISTPDPEMAVSSFLTYYENKTGKKWSEGCAQVETGADEGGCTAHNKIGQLTTDEKMWLHLQDKKHLEETGESDSRAKEADITTPSEEVEVETDKKEEPTHHVE